MYPYNETMVCCRLKNEMYCPALGLYLVLHELPGKGWFFSTNKIYTRDIPVCTAESRGHLYAKILHLSDIYHNTRAFMAQYHREKPFRISTRKCVIIGMTDASGFNFN